MVSSPNTIDNDYTNLNKSLQPKRKINNITTDVAKAIGDVFLQTNKFDERKRASTRNNKLNQFSSSIEGASEGMKSSFILTVNYLSNNNLLKKEGIKSLKLNKLLNNSSDQENPQNDADKKLQAILDELTQELPDKDKLKLDQYVSKGLLDLSKEADSADKLGKKITDLEQENANLKSELNASDTINEIALESSISRWSTNNISRIGNYIKKLNEDSSISPEKKARKILIAANSYRLWGIGTRFNTKLFRRFDVNKEYNKAIKRLSKLADEANNKGNNQKKLSIVYVMKQINRAHTKYIEATSINESTKKAHTKNIYNKIAA